MKLRIKSLHNDANKMCFTFTVFRKKYKFKCMRFLSSIYRENWHAFFSKNTMFDIKCEAMAVTNSEVEPLPHWCIHTVRVKHPNKHAEYKKVFV